MPPVLAVDSTTAITSTPEELNVLDGITATVTELNYTDGVTSNIQTQLDAKTADGDNVNNLVGDTSVALALSMAMVMTTTCSLWSTSRTVLSS